MTQAEFPTDLHGARIAESSHAVLGATFELMGRRTRAIAQYWESAAFAWEPEMRFGLQVEYLRRMADDYAEAVSGALAPWAEAQPAAEAAATPSPAVLADAAPATPAETRLAAEPATFAEPEPPKPPKAGKRPEGSAAADEGHLGGHDGHGLDVRA